MYVQVVVESPCGALIETFIHSFILPYLVGCIYIVYNYNYVLHVGSARTDPVVADDVMAAVAAAAAAAAVNIDADPVDFLSVSLAIGSLSSVHIAVDSDVKPPSDQPDYVLRVSRCLERLARRLLCRLVARWSSFSASLSASQPASESVCQ